MFPSLTLSNKFQDLNGLEGECFGGLAKGEDRLYSNRKGLLNDFRILGDGLIDSIIVQKEIWINGCTITIYHDLSIKHIEINFEDSAYL